VIGVEAGFDPEALGLLRGRVRLTIGAAGLEAWGEAVINPGHQVTDRLVVRRSGFADPDTLATGSTLSAGDLDPALVTALADPDTSVTLRVEEIEDPSPLLLVGRGGAPVPRTRLGLLWRHADHTVELGTARPGIPALPAGARTVAVSVSGPLDTLPPDAIGRLLVAVGQGARIALLEPDGGPAEPLLAAGFPPVPALWLGRPTRPSADRSEIAALLRSSRVPSVVKVPLDEATVLLEALAAAVPALRLAVPDGAADVGTKLVWVPVEQAGALLSRAPGPQAAIVAEPRATGDSVELETVVRALTAAGITPRTVSEALRPLGVTRRRVYAIVAAESESPV
jgi:hypothetical protein